MVLSPVIFAFFYESNKWHFLEVEAYIHLRKWKMYNCWNLFDNALNLEQTGFYFRVFL